MMVPVRDGVCEVLLVCLSVDSACCFLQLFYNQQIFVMWTKNVFGGK